MGPTLKKCQPKNADLTKFIKNNRQVKWIGASKHTEQEKVDIQTEEFYLLKG